MLNGYDLMHVTYYLFYHKSIQVSHYHVTVGPGGEWWIFWIVEVPLQEGSEYKVLAKTFNMDWRAS